MHPDILLISSDRRTRSLLFAQLREEGYDVLPTALVEKALFFLDRGLQPRLILLDVHAEDPAQTVERLLHCSTAPLVVLVGGYERERVRRAPRVAVVSRPISIGDLVQAVKHILDPPLDVRSNQAGTRPRPSE
ncbi:MAG: hypothetical protein D6704_03465 [Nitrospirae bacterium]|nr:MAG: hypothetical protein D6704_03465 [Nitrospirota bacterium]